MKRLLLTTALASALLASAAAEAATVHSSNGHHATVSESARPILQCVVDKLEAAGVRITALGGNRAGHCSERHMHSCGKALDVNQYARDRGGPPRHLSSAAASACGAVSGSWWANSDNGHFQVGGYAGNHSNTRVASRHRGTHTYSARRHYRRIMVASAPDRLIAH